MSLERIYKFLHSSDIVTWVGHGVMGALLYIPFGFAGVFAAFLYREVSDLLEWWAAPQPKRRLRDKLRDGFFDLWSPMVGAVIMSLIL